MTMQTPDEIRSDLPPDLEPAERDALLALGLHLQAVRPVPAPTFRGELGRRLLGASASRRPRATTPRAVRALAAVYVTTGALLLSVAALGLTGAGPLAPS